MTSGEINVFAAYKFNSQYYEKRDLEKAIVNAVKNTQKRLQSRIEGLTLRLISQDTITSGDFVGNFVQESLKSSAVNIFELSDREPNVTFELGYSMGISGLKFSQAERFDILIQSNAVSHRDTISDLLGRFIVTYDYDGPRSYAQIQHKIEEELERKIVALINDDKFLKNLVWKVKGEKVYVICPYISPEDQNRFGVRSALSEYGDFNEVYEICMFLRGALNCDVEYMHSEKAKGVKDLFEQHLVVVGGPMWNPYIRELMKEYNSPLQYNWSPDETTEDYIVVTENKNRFYTKWQDVQNKTDIVKDFGVFGIIPNKYSSEKVIVLVSGITSLGGLGAVRAFTGGDVSHENCLSIVHHAGLNGYFMAVVETDVRWGEFPFPCRIQQNNIYCYDPASRQWRTAADE